MSAYSRLALVLLGVFVTIFSIGLFFYVGQARVDVARELAGVEQLALALPAPDQLPPAVVGSLRHLRPATAAMDAAGHGGLVELFGGLMGVENARVINGWRIEPGDEVDEIAEGFVLIAGAYGVGMLLSFVALYIAVRRGTRPLMALADAMAGVGRGQLSSRLARSETTELNRVIECFNAMADALEQEQRTVSRLLKELLEIQDKERAHIARTLHDDLGQYLTGIRAQAQSWVYDPDLGEEQARQAGQLAEHCETLQAHFRMLLQDLHPLVMEQLGLQGALLHLVEQWQRLSGVPCGVDIGDNLPELSGERQTHLYRLLQESLNNVSRHAGATRVELSVQWRQPLLEVAVADNGCGARLASVPVGLGLRSMRERARSLGGELNIVSAEGKGTRVKLTIPMPPAKAADNRSVV